VRDGWVRELKCDGASGGAAGVHEISRMSDLLASDQMRMNYAIKSVTRAGSARPSKPARLPIPRPLYGVPGNFEQLARLRGQMRVRARWSRQSPATARMDALLNTSRIALF